MLDQPFRRLLVGLVMVLSAAAAPAQPADECTGAALDGSDSLPFGGATTPANASFNVSGAGCTNPAFALDAAVCLRPTNNCVVNFTCTFTSDNVTPQGYLNVRNVGSDACNAGAGACVANVGLGASPRAINNISLTGGTSYCFICHTDDQTMPFANQSFSITLAAGSASCGALPVDLQGFEVN